MMKNRLGILSVFLTIDGECNPWGQGKWTVFVRTRGCGVGCHWCDTKYSWSFKGGETFWPVELFEIVKLYSNGVRKVTLTGGEPLEQDHVALATFLSILADKKYNVSVETSGTQNVIEFRQSFYHMLPHELGRLSFIVDYKLKGSKFKGQMDLKGHFQYLPRGDFVKFVIDSYDDFLEATEVAGYLDSCRNFKAQMYFSPSHGNITGKELFDWMVKFGLPAKNVGINIQAHKYIWPDDAREEEDLIGVDFTKRYVGRAAFLASVRRSEAVSDEE